ncbi:MAG TPA: hypothetical protein VD862_02720 [Candidatus Paceibacterota bacterium]|nr:hypothetical protein [Candidatus Paceibacterota bacterium]
MTALSLMTGPRGRVGAAAARRGFAVPFFALAAFFGFTALRAFGFRGVLRFRFAGRRTFFAGLRAAFFLAAFFGLRTAFFFLFAGFVLATFGYHVSS